MPPEYPDDTEYQEVTIASVEVDGKGHVSIGHDGWGLFCGENPPMVPEIGQTARLYGRGLVRGLFIAGIRFWYRTEAEEKEYSEIALYGRDAADWLDRWDNDRGVWSITMGGLGPGYEQAIQITAAEILRWHLKEQTDLDNSEAWPQVSEGVSKALTSLPVVERLGLSGAQWGAAMNLAAQLYRRGPRAVMKDESVKDRHIQVCRHFPSGRA